MRIKWNKMRSKNYTQVQARFDFEERVEDKNVTV